MAGHAQDYGPALQQRGYSPGHPQQQKQQQYYEGGHYYEEPQGQMGQMRRSPHQQQQTPPGEGQRPRPPPVRNYGNGPSPPQSYMGQGQGPPGGGNGGGGGGGGGPQGHNMGGRPGRGGYSGMTREGGSGRGMPPQMQNYNGRPPPPRQRSDQEPTPLDQSMRAMTLNGDVGPRRQNPPPEQMRPPQQGMRRPPGPPGQYIDTQQPMGRPPPNRGPPPPNDQYDSPINQRSPPNMYPPQQGGPPRGPPRQGPPPPIRNYSGKPAGEWEGDQYDGSNQGGGGHYQTNGAPPHLRSPPHMAPPQRSMTMPVRADDYRSPPPPGGQNQYQQGRVLPQHNPNNFSSPRGYGQPPPAMEQNLPPDAYGGLEVVDDYGTDDILDDYYGGPDSGYDGLHESSHYNHQQNSNHYQTSQEPNDYQNGYRRGSEGQVQTPFSPVVQNEHYDPAWELPNPNSNASFAAQAHRSRSQPNLRGTPGGPVRNSGQSQFSQHSQYNAIPEMPGDAPPLPSPISGHFPSQAELPPVLRVKTPGPGQRPPMHNMPATPQTPQNYYPPQQYPGRTPSDERTHRSSPAQSIRSSNPDALPEHPVPVRPGHMQEQHLQSPQGHPPPIRQYNSRGSIDSQSASRAPVKGPITQVELERLQISARSNSGDQALQLKLAKAYIEAADVLSDQGGRADAKTTKKNRENFIFDAHKLIKKLAGGSHPYAEAMFFLAQCHGDGSLGLVVDREKAFSLYQSAAKLNHAGSAYRTAVCCEIGAGTKKDPQKALQWYRKAASLGDTGAMYKLGIILLKGLLGQPKSPRDALPWLKRAAEQADAENPHALHEMGLLYEAPASRDGSIIPDPNYARELFTQAAELGYPPSQFRLGHAFEFGALGCPIDPRRSIMWYSRAAMNGEAESELALSGWYLTGSEGVLEQSDTEAYLWARRAAEKGLMKAEYAVGHLTEAGFGVPADLEEAKRWYYKAASQGFPKAQQRLNELKNGGKAAQGKHRERLSRSNVKKDEDCVVM